MAVISCGFAWCKWNTSDLYEGRIGSCRCNTPITLKYNSTDELFDIDLAEEIEFTEFMECLNFVPDLDKVKRNKERTSEPVKELPNPEKVDISVCGFKVCKWNTATSGKDENCKCDCSDKVILEYDDTNSILGDVMRYPESYEHRKEFLVCKTFVWGNWGR